MSRSSFLALGGAALLALPGAALQAQTGITAPAPTPPAVQLQTVTVTERAGSLGLAARLGLRNDIRAAMIDERRLALEVRRLAAREFALQRRVDSVHAVGAGLQRDIDAMTRETDALRSRRADVERELAAHDAASLAIVPGPVPVVGDADGGDLAARGGGRRR